MADDDEETPDDVTDDDTEETPDDTEDEDRLPADHPLVKAYNATKAQLADQKKKRAAAMAELATLRKGKLPPDQKVIEDAKDEARAEALRGAGEKVAAAEIKAALTGLVDDPADIVEDLNLAKFLDDDGDVDTEMVSKLKKKYEALKLIKKKTERTDLGQGKKRGSGGKTSAQERADARLAKHGLKAG